MDDFDRVRQKIRDLQSRFLGAQGTGTDYSPESTPPQDFWKRHYEQEKRKWEEQFQLKESALSRRIQEMESRLTQQRPPQTPLTSPQSPALEHSARQELERQISELRLRMEALQSENLELRSQNAKAFQLHKNEIEETAALSQQLEAEKRRRQEDAASFQQGMSNARQELEKRAQKLELEKTELAGLIDDIKANNYSLAAEHKVLKEENAILKENILHHHETEAMREQLHFAAQEKMAEGLSRRLRNYLALLMGAAEQGLRTEMLDSRAQAEKTVDEFLELSRQPEPRMEPLPANDLMDSVLKDLADRARQAQVSFAKDWGDVPAMQGDKTLLKEAFRQIILNAIEASPPGAVIRLKSFLHPAGKVEVQITDSGNGLPDAVLGKLFQPFFTTKKGHRGLGLCRAKKIVNIHHGWITLSGSQDGGTTAAVELPVTSPR